jgi:O-antigen/teichoic acid export membrane protein
MSRDLAAQAVRGSAIRLGAEVVGRALSVATTFLIAVALDAAGFGSFAALSGVAVIVAELADLGLTGTAAPALVSGRLSLRALLRPKLAISAALLALAVLQAALGLTGSALLLFAFVLYFVGAGWCEILGVALRASGRPGQEAAVLLALRASGLLAVGLALAGGASLSRVAWAQAASTLPALALAGALLVPRPRPGAGAPDPGPLRVLREALPLAVNGGLALLSLRVELLLLYALQDPLQAGLFGAALKFLESVNAVPAAVVAGALPALTREALAPASDAVRARTAQLVLLLAVPAAAGLLLLAPGLAVLLGPGYAGAAPLLRLLAPGVVVLFTNAVLLHALIAAGRADRLPWLTALRVAAAAVLAAVSVPIWGASGAAISFLASELLLLLLARRAASAVGFPVRLRGPLLGAVAATVPMALVVAVLPLSTLPAVAAGAAVYAATLLASRRRLGYI